MFVYINVLTNIRYPIIFNHVPSNEHFVYLIVA